MGIFNFLKRIIVEEKKPAGDGSSEEKVENVKMGDLNRLMSKKKAENRKENDLVLSLIKERLNQAIRDLGNNKRVLESIDLKDRKELEKIKLIVKDNLANYCEALGMLIGRLKELDREDIEKLIPKINFLFQDFEKRSFVSYQKANFLIGKEIQAVRISGKNFLDDLRGILDSNKKFARDYKMIKSLDLKIKELEGNDGLIKETEEKIQGLDGAVENRKKEIVELKSKLKSVMESKEYLESESERKSIGENKAKLRKSVSELRNMLDFKKIAGVVHVNNKKMSILREYKSNFEKVFMEEGGERIIALLNDSGLADSAVTSKIEEILSERESVNESEKKLSKKGGASEEIESRIGRLNETIDKEAGEKEGEMKKLEKFEAGRVKIIDSLKKELLEFNVILEK